MARIGVLALQGGFAEHVAELAKLGAEPVLVRDRAALKGLDGIILPGGESTAQARLLKAFSMYEPLKDMIQNGFPVMGTCAGLILLAREIEGEPAHFGLLPVRVCRNAYGRQLASFHSFGDFDGLGRVPMTFIRAPLITEVFPGANVLAREGGKPVAVSFKNMLAMSFHPELDKCDTVHSAFLQFWVQKL